MDSTPVSISLLFGFDPAVQRDLLDCVAGPGALVVWCGGSPDEAFRVKDWWARELENGDKCDVNLVMGSVKQEASFANSFVENLARSQPEVRFSVRVLAPHEGSFGHRAALKFRIGRFLARLEGLVNVAIQTDGAKAKE